MRVDLELVRRNLCESREEAKELIRDNFVEVDGIIIKKITKQVSGDSKINILGQRQFVSRGGKKLQGVLKEVFGDDKNIFETLKNLEAIDVGSSTGGFSDCLLHYGISHVDAVDVGTLQLHKKLKNNEKVSVYENTDIRNFKSKKKYGIIVADLSFISLKNIFTHLIDFGSPGAIFILLIKPQFEVGIGNTKKGIVKDKSLIEKILSEYLNISKDYGFENSKIYQSSLKGGDGNQEYFLYGILK